MKDRLIELTKQNTTEFINPFAYEYGDSAEQFADHLLANGVIVPPVSIGDSLWTIYRKRPKEWKVVYIGFNGCEWVINLYWDGDKDRYSTMSVDDRYIGKTVFLTKEEAEQALKEREQSDL